MIPAKAVIDMNGSRGPHNQEPFATASLARTVVNLSKGQIIYSQGDPADSLFYIQRGRAKISVTSPFGKEATLALQNKGGFLGEECISGAHTVRLATATAVVPCTMLRIESREMMQALNADRSLAHHFESFLLTRCTRMQAELIDQLLNSSERRLARTLLSLAQLDGGVEGTIQLITQQTLAQMIGTTRSRVSFFMNRFRKKGYIRYSGATGTVTVYSSLFNVLLNDHIHS